MGELKVHIWQVMLWEFKNNKNTIETAEKNVVYTAHVTSLTIKSKTHFQSFIMAIHHWDELRAGIHQDALRKMMEQIHLKILEN